MNSGPVAFQRRMAAVEQLLAAPPTWEGLEKAFAPASVPDRFRPDEPVSKLLAALWQTADGRRLLDWIFALTIDAPYPHIGATRDAAALAAKAHEARAAVGLVVLKAIEEGTELLNQKEPRR